MFVAGWRSQVSRLPHKQENAGPNPAPATNIMKLSEITQTELTEVIGQSSSWREALGLLGSKTTNNSRLKARCLELDISTAHFKGKSWRKGSGSGRDKAKAAAAQRRWYESNSTAHRAAVSGLQKKKREHLRDLKASTPCADCRQVFPYYVMDFDHLGDKAFNLGGQEATSASWERLLAEVEKCEIVCSNCHRVRSHERRSMVP